MRSTPQNRAETALQPLASWPLEQRRRVRGIFTDIDDTLTTAGHITSDALQALHDLRAAGLVVIAVTGRPLGWCREFLAGDSPWPVHAMVAENGAAALVPPTDDNALQCLYQDDAATREQHRRRMEQVAARIAREVPGAQRSRDSSGRETDLAIDHHEFADLSQEQMDAVLAIMRSEGMHTSVSSIHLHGCFSPHDKWSGAEWIVRTLLERELQLERGHWVFVGDSGNDQALFRQFDNSVGVANIAPLLATLKYPPRYITQGERGAGFAEVALALLHAGADRA